MSIPRNFPYKFSGNVEDLDKFASVTVSAGATVEIVSQQVPSNVGLAWLTYFGHGIDTLSAFALSVFSIQINGVPVQNYNSIQDQIGKFDEPRRIVPVVVKPSQTFRCVVTNNDSVAHLYAARFQGFYDKSIDRVIRRG